MQSAVTDHITGKVTVTGTMDGDTLVDYVYRRTKKQARIVPQPEPEPEPEPEKKEEPAAEEAKPEEAKKEEGGGESNKEGEEKKEEGNKEEPNNDVVTGIPEEELKRMMQHYYQPLYVIERIPPPQLFSDENPNACCIS